MEILVAITYISDRAQGNELALAVEGWRKHFKEPHRILVVGDRPTVGDVEWLPLERVPAKEGQYRPALDICAKLEAVCIYCSEHGIDHFVWASDDFFAVNDFTLDDIRLPKYYEDELPSRWDKTQNEFWHTQIKTRRLCERMGYGTVNWTTHLPMWFNVGKLYWLIRDFDLTNRGHIIENIYFNRYMPDGRPIKLDKDRDRFKWPVWFTPLDREALHKAFATKIWITCSVNGWSPELEAELRKHYGL